MALQESPLRLVSNDAHDAGQAAKKFHIELEPSLFINME